MLLPLLPFDIVGDLAEEAQSALPNAPVRPDGLRAATPTRLDRARLGLGLVLRRLAERVEPALPAGSPEVGAVDAVLTLRPMFTVHGSQMRDAMADARDWNAEVIAEFRANKGEVKAPYDDPPPMLLLHTIGAKSGREHVVPMRCLPDGESLYVFASAHGSDRNPDWYHNLVAHPEITIEQGTETIPVRATEVRGAERDAVFARQAARFPVFAEYARKLARTIPVIRLERRPA